MNPKASFGNIFRELAAGYYTLFMQDNSSNKLHCASLLKFESHYPPLRGIIRPASFSALCF
jgi:hypothetical protein